MGVGVKPFLLLLFLQIHAITAIRDKIPCIENDKFYRNPNRQEQINYRTGSNQITVVAFQSVQLAQALFLQKNQMLQNVFLISVTLSPEPQ